MVQSMSEKNSFRRGREVYESTIATAFFKSKMGKHWEWDFNHEMGYMVTNVKSR